VRRQSPNATRPRCSLRIVVTGSESTGKTILARQLAGHLGAPCVPEYAREYATRVRRALRETDVEPIARGQIALEDTALALDPRRVILDTDLVSTVVYARYYYGTCPEWIVDAAQARLGSVYLLLDIDLPWTADHVRDRPEARLEIQQLFHRQLREFGAHTVEVSGLGELRFQRALRAVEQLAFSKG
jgi:NadR type nicotinamide-nucleotide adenylyltransferase